MNFLNHINVFDEETQNAILYAIMIGIPIWALTYLIVSQLHGLHII